MKMKGIVALGAIGNAAHADVPAPPTAAPYIVLSDNLDEPNGYGFCLDTHGRGRSDLMQTHTCKPHREGEPRDYSGYDTRFSHDPDAGQIASHAYEGFCMQALIADEVTVFVLLECSDHPRQKFIHDETDQTLRLAEDEERCIGVASESVPAGPWVKRPLALENCADVDASLARWSVVAE